jgi:hypothetical protein
MLLLLGMASREEAGSGAVHGMRRGPSKPSLEELVPAGVGRVATFCAAQLVPAACRLRRGDLSAAISLRAKLVSINSGQIDPSAPGARFQIHLHHRSGSERQWLVCSAPVQGGPEAGRVGRCGAVATIGEP